MSAPVYPEGTWLGLLGADGVKRLLQYHTPSGDQRVASRGKSLMMIGTSEFLRIARELVPEFVPGHPCRVAMEEVLTDDHPVRSQALNAVWNALLGLDRVSV